MSGVALIVGGGVYGASIAAYLKAQRGFDRAILFEAEDRLFSRSSYVNQARVHNGYHYPRSFTTAYRSRVNFPRFVAEFEACVVKNFTKLYAVARLNSKVSARQFERFCSSIGASLDTPEPEQLSLFDARLIERAYVCQEYGFDAVALGRMLSKALQEAEVDVRTSAWVDSAVADPAGVTVSGWRGADRQAFQERGDVLFNCTYSGLQRLAGGEGDNRFSLKHEIAEMALVEPPPELEGLALTVVDGPFFSLMPFPDRGLHTLSHVRYTPHLSWQEDETRSPYAVLDDYSQVSRGDRMIRDAARFVPTLAKAVQRGSLFEVKTVPTYTEGNDGRPILLHKDRSHGRVYSVLGGKIDNVYDILERLDREPLMRRAEAA